MSSNTVGIFDFDEFDQQFDWILKTPSLDEIAEMATSGDDTLTGTNDAETLEGLGGNDTLFGLGGADILRGGDGRDTLIGGGNRDVLDGGRGADTADYSVHQQRVVADLADSSRNAFSAFGDTFISIESLRGSQANDSLRGDDRNNRLWGEDGDDRLFGRDGNDLMRGGDGNDMLAGGNGDDRLFGDDGDDVLLAQDGDDTLSGGAGADTFQFFEGDGTDTISDFEVGVDIIEFRNIDACSLSVDVTAYSGGTRISYGTDNILIEGVGRSDFDLPDIRVSFMDNLYEIRALYVNPYDSFDDYYDYINFERQHSNGDYFFCIDRSNGRGRNGNDAMVVDPSNTERVVLEGGDGDDTLVAGTGGSALFGENGDDTLIGNTGRDFLYGGSLEDDDTLIGGDGDDRFAAGLGNDVLEAGEGFDTIDFSYRPGGQTEGINFDLRSQTLLSGQWTDTTFSGFEAVTGTSFDDRIVGDDGRNVLEGGSGNDTIYGQGGDDYIDGRSGSNRLFGQDGDDVIDGGNHQDIIRGGLGDDTINARYGDDTVYGGDGDDILNGWYGTDILYGGDGNDTLRGGTNNLVSRDSGDVLFGGSGEDHFVWAPGITTYTGGSDADLFELSYSPSLDVVTTITDFETGVDTFRVGSSDTNQDDVDYFNISEIDGDTYLDFDYTLSNGDIASGTAIFEGVSAEDLGFV